MNILLFVGAGASSELEVPAMMQMVLQFRAHLHERGLACKILGILDARINSGNYDMENLIEELDQLERGHEVAKLWGAASEGSLAQEVHIVRQEAEWFVQHACERVETARAAKLWIPTLRKIHPHEVTIATTNYDRAVELAAGRLGLKLTDGFDDFGENEWARWRGFDDPGDLRLIKVHGSTDWYHSVERDAVWKLRHAMPLFGAVTLYIERTEPLKLKSAVVLPSREKKVTEVPYPALTYEFHRSAKEAQIAIFLGTSLRDPDIRSVFTDCAKRIPTFLVSRNDIGEKRYLPSEAKTLRQSASHFLICSLPCALRCQSGNDLVLSLESAPTQGQPILGWLMIATDANGSTDERCQAIDRLADSRVALDREEVEGLLRNVDPDVRTYALALVQDSPDRIELMGLVRELAGGEAESAFQKEAELLLTIVNQSG